MSILEKINNIETNNESALNIRIIPDGEKITFHNIYNGYCYYRR